MDAPLQNKPWTRWRHPPGCPDGDWCAGNNICYWRCVDDGEDDDVADALERAYPKGEE